MTVASVRQDNSYRWKDRQRRWVLEVFSIVNRKKNTSRLVRNLNIPELLHWDTSWCQCGFSATLGWMREASVWEIKCEDWTQLTEHTETFNKILRSGDATSSSYLFSSLFGLRLSILCMAASISPMQNRTKALNTKDSTGKGIFVHIISWNAFRNSLFCSNAIYLTSFAKIIITIV